MRLPGTRNNRKAKAKRYYPMTCGFADCLTIGLGAAVVGLVAGVGGTYLLAGRKSEGQLAPRPRRVPATAGLGGHKKRWRKSLGGCGCGR